MLQRSFRPRRLGFTLVELLVVIAIIGILIALLLPAVQAAREAARRSQCLSHVRQLALASINHHDAQGHFPTGGWGWNMVGDPDRGFSREQPGGWLYNILPFTEEGNLHDLGADGDPEEISEEQRMGARQVLATPLTIINCPSRRPLSVYPQTFAVANALPTTGVAGRSDFAINAGTFYEEVPANEPGAGGPSCSVNYDPCYTEHDTWLETLPDIQRNPWKLNGISYQRSEVTIAQVIDGTTNTYLLGEKFLFSRNYDTGQDAGDNETWCTGFNNDNFRIVYTEILRGGNRYYPPVSDRAGGVAQASRRFGAAHASVWNVAFCDGSARGLSYNIDGRIASLLSDRRDEEMIDSGDL